MPVPSDDNAGNLHVGAAPDAERLDDLARAYLALDARRSEIVAELEGIKAELRRLGTGTHRTRSGAAVTVAANRRFDSERAETVLPEPLLRLCVATAIDAKRAKQHLPQALYEACMVERGEPRVTIR